MPSFRPQAALAEFDRLAKLADQGAALDWLDRMRPAFAGHRDPLIRARFVLRAAALRETRQPMLALVDDLVGTLVVFHALGQPSDLVLAVARTAYWCHRLGLMAPALACGELVLARPELAPTERLRLQVALITHLAQERLLPEAWATLAQAESAQGTSPMADWLVTGQRALLHCVEAMRAGAVRAIYTLDLPLVAPDAAAVEAQLQACEAALVRLPQAGAELPKPVYLLAVHAALRGDAAAVGRLLDRQPDRDRSGLARALTLYNRGWCRRVLGDPARALADQRQALALLAGMAAHRLEAQVWQELSQCAEALGDAAGALAALHARTRALAMLQQASHRTLRRLAELLGRLGWPAGRQTVPAAGPQASPPATTSGPASPGLAVAVAGPARGGRPADAALLARAARRYLTQLPRRLPYARLAEALGVSLRTLQLSARRHEDMSLGDLLRRHVMQRALTLLCQADEPIAEIARQLGYADPGSFSRDVRRHFGCTPTQLRAGLARPGTTEAVAAPVTGRRGEVQAPGPAGPPDQGQAPAVPPRSG